MLYNALRLACITVSSIKTWKAVVDSGDRGLARRCMILWLLTLSGISVEPIVDSVLAHQIPMYEGLKIIVAGWLLLAHFYLPESAAIANTPRRQQERQEVKADGGRPSSRMDGVQRKALRNSQELYPPSIESSTRSYRHVSQPDESMATSGMDNLDFGRFKRNLERRRTSNSVQSNTEYSHRGSGPHGDGAGPSTKARLSEDLYPTRAGPLSNLFDISTKVSDTTRIKPDVIKERTPTAETVIPERKSLPDTYQFGLEASSRKRPLSVASSEAKLYRQKQQVRRRPLQRSQSAMDSYEAESSTSRMNKRLRELLEDERAEGSSSNESGRPPSRERTIDRTLSLDPHQGEFSGEADIPRPKSSGKNHKAVAVLSRSISTPGALEMMPPPPLPPQRQNSQEVRKRKEHSPIDRRSSLSKTDQASNGYDVGMKNVQDWLKERNPSLISPPLSAKSIELSGNAARLEKRPSGSLHRDIPSDLDLQNPQKPYKRRAYRQLAPQNGPKRLAVGETEHIGDGEDDRDYVQPKDTTTSSPRPKPQIPSQIQDRPLPRRIDPARSLHHDQVRSTGPNSNNGRRTPNERRIDPLRDQPEVDPFLPSASQDRYSAPRKASTLRDSHAPSMTTTPKATEKTATVPTSDFTFRASTPKSSSAPLLTTSYYSDDDDDNSTISPLIKLRQSQLKQRQLDDYYGVRESSFARRQEDGLVFNEVHEAWERDDDDTLARNAYLELLEMEEVHGRAEPQWNQQQEEEVSPISSYGSDHVNSSIPHSQPITPSAGLHRPVAFNGESSRRSQPDLQPKRSQSDLTMQRSSSNDIRNTPAVVRAASSPALDQRPLNTRILSSSLRKDDHQKSSFLTSSSTASPAKRPSTPGKVLESETSRRPRHPGLYTPSKKRPTFISSEWQDRPSQSPRPSTPKLSSR